MNMKKILNVLGMLFAVIIGIALLITEAATYFAFEIDTLTDEAGILSAAQKVTAADFIKDSEGNDTPLYQTFQTEMTELQFTTEQISEIAAGDGFGAMLSDVSVMQYKMLLGNKLDEFVVKQAVDEAFEAHIDEITLSDETEITPEAKHSIYALIYHITEDTALNPLNFSRGAQLLLKFFYAVQNNPDGAKFLLFLICFVCVALICLCRWRIWEGIFWGGVLTFTLAWFFFLDIRTILEAAVKAYSAGNNPIITAVLNQSAASLAASLKADGVAGMIIGGLVALVGAVIGFLKKYRNKKKLEERRKRKLERIEAARRALNSDSFGGDNNTGQTNGDTRPIGTSPNGTKPS
ncbi:MAG: hypothetical protein GX061_04145 [Eubacteriaceae bacterium]|nr:hypothetical protein [Eubacteriaceae bacterium]